MATALILQAFRSRTASTSTAPLFNRSNPLLLLGRRRHYSDENPKAEVEESKATNETEDAVLTPEQEKLKAKEAEVMDLTVRVMDEDRCKATYE